MNSSVETSTRADPANPPEAAATVTTAAGSEPTAAPGSAQSSRGLRRLFRRRRDAAGAGSPAEAATPAGFGLDLDVAPDDPLIGYCQQVAGVVDVDALQLDSPALRQLKEAGTKLVVPLVTQGELIGLLMLGPRLSERDYSRDDRQLLDTLAGHAAPALRVGQLVREQEAELVTRERIEQELRVAQLIQQQFLPKRLPELVGWNVSAFYRPARTVGGDFYDFIELPDGRVFVVVGDVTDKGVPAALVMASTHSILRASAARLVSPGDVLQHVNDVLYDDIPAHMFVTCLALVLDPGTGEISYANAGHDLPYVRTADGVVELRARGMPLGLMPGMEYEEKTTVLRPGDCVLLHSDGLAEAHAPDREMFGFPRLKQLVEKKVSGKELIDVVLAAHEEFIGPGGEQEDDITMVTLEHAAGSQGDAPATTGAELRSAGQPGDSTSSDRPADEVVALDDFTLPSEPGNERAALARVEQAVADLGLPSLRLEGLKTAVAEATMNAIEHGNKNQPELPVHIRVLATADAVTVTVTDVGGLPVDAPTPSTPDLEAKLAGLQTPRGWGLFLIKNMVDEMNVSADGEHHTVSLTVRLHESPTEDHDAKHL